MRKMGDRVGTGRGSVSSIWAFPSGKKKNKKTKKKKACIDLFPTIFLASGQREVNLRVLFIPSNNSFFSEMKCVRIDLPVRWSQMK